ncbi:hypothetical protein DTO271G3_1874 [Paecilomyces variotii]|nr:hypothetical protein DTO271G3_1874 [Paecilomyces variotii]
MPPRKRKSEATAAVVDEIPKRTRRSLRGAARAGSPKGVSSVEKETKATAAKSGKDLSGEKSESLTKPTAGKKTEQKTNIDRGDEGDNNRSYWLMKAEPESRLVKGIDVKFSIDDLQAAEEPEAWDGVRNFVARNNMRNMKKGDYAFFYHSNCKTPGIVGMMEIVEEHSVDESAFDPAHPYFDPKSSREKPKWDVVHVEFRRKFGRMVSLNELKDHGKPGGPLENLQMLKQSRLSVSAVTAEEWRFIMDLVEKEEATS